MGYCSERVEVVGEAAWRDAAARGGEVVGEAAWWDAAARGGEGVKFEYSVLSAPISHKGGSACIFSHVGAVFVYSSTWRLSPMNTRNL